MYIDDSVNVKRFKIMEYEQGKQAKLDGKSIEYNPYRHNGTAEQYEEWRKGWLA